jgi:hypothetical protein
MPIIMRSIDAGEDAAAGPDLAQLEGATLAAGISAPG